MSFKVQEESTYRLSSGGKSYKSRLWDQFSLEHSLSPVPHTTRIALLSSLERQTK